jgi:hypothetical protein
LILINESLIEVRFNRKLSLGLFGLQNVPRSGVDSEGKCHYSDFSFEIWVVDRVLVFYEKKMTDSTRILGSLIPWKFSL